jgi:Protein of unknown function (DUF2877)
MFRFPATLIGGGARDHLISAREGAVLAVFRRSFYLETPAGALVCIGPAAIGAGPLNMICDLPDRTDWDASGLKPDARVSISGFRITVAGQFEFDFEAAPLWRPAALSEQWTETTLATGFAALDIAATAHDLSDGLAALVLRDPPAVNRVVAAARPGHHELGNWLDRAMRTPPDDMREPPPGIASLFGLGPGLTPSGDDLIGGAMIALRGFGHGAAADCLAGWALPIARRNTGKISLAHLARAALGEGADALHRAIVVIADGDTTRLKPCLAAIDAIGHSSGWDALAGAVAVMRRIG